MITVAVLVGAFAGYYGARYSGRRWPWLWCLIGAMVASTIFGVAQGLFRAYSPPN
jgi:uncharacterized BrkB/YihY/UPF0761 family membrane protein